MDDIELLSIIDSKIETGIGGKSGDVSSTRQTIFDRYLGELYGNEKEGQSKITTREVFETIEWAMPSIIRVFESTDRIVQFDPVSAEDEAGAEQETDAVIHVYRKDNNGFVVTHNLVKSALMNPNSYVKVYRDEREITTTERYKNLNEQELVRLMQDDDVELVASDVNEDGMFDVEISRTCSEGKTKVQCIPEDQIIVDSNQTELSLDECEFACHWEMKTQSYLVENGYSLKELEQTGTDTDINAERTNRDYYTDESNYVAESKGALKKYKVYECYLFVDYNGDGIAERRRVVKIGNKIFENEEIEMMPIAAAASILMPHKHTGLSLAQSIIDLQDVKTFFMRQTVNNMSRVNNPRTVINENINLGDILANRTNGFIRSKGTGDPRANMSSEPIQPIIGQVLPLLQLLDEQKEGRSGITRNSMGLDADILAKSTEGAFMGALEKAEQRVEFIVRVLAETIFKDIFLKIHHLLLTHGDTKEMRLNGQWVLVNPAEWKKRDSMTVNVGLGIGSRNQKMAAARVIIAEQDKLIASGAMGTLVNPQGIYNGKRLLVEAAGEKNVDKYFMNPSMTPPKPPSPPQPDPNMLMIQSNERIENIRSQVKMAEIKQKGQIEFARFQFDQAKAAREQQFNDVELRYKNQIEELKAQINASKNRDDSASKAMTAKIDQLELQLKQAQSDEKLAMEKYKADLDAETKIQLKTMDLVGIEKDPEEIIDINQQEIDAKLSAIAQIVADMNQPKVIVRDKDGNPVGVKNVGTGEIRTIIKDSEGLPVGIE